MVVSGFPKIARKILESIDQKLNPLNPYNDEWAKSVDLKERPFDGFYPSEVDLGSYNTRPSDRLSRIKHDTVAMNIMKERPVPDIDDLKLKQRLVQRNKMNMVIKGKTSGILASTILSPEDIRNYS